jgi:hypothetical protein
MSSHRVVVRLRPGSDGDATHVPTPGTLSQVNPPTLYLEKIADQWMQARGEAGAGVKYILEALPAGYTMWQRARPSAPQHIDKYLYGHPQSKKFDSPNRFYPHFQHLMDNGGDSFGCPCTVCAGSVGVLPKGSSGSAKMSSSSTASSRPSTPVTAAPITSQRFLPPNHTVPAPVVQSRGRPKTTGTGLDTTRVDEEGTPDVYRNLIDKLKRHNTVDEVIEEPLSPDWRSEQNILPGLLHSLKANDQWVPRTGDIVLYIRDLPGGVDFVRDKATGEFHLYNEDTEETLGSPSWEAGLVGETPAEVSTIADLYQSDRKTNVIYSGVRVEPLPNPNDTDKSLSKRHKYVSLRQTRPFMLWKVLLQHVPQEEWHATVLNAMTTISTLSLLGKYRFRGTWPDASIYCHGLYLGSELLAVDDTVRLLPNTKFGQTSCTDILVIKTIRLKWSNMDKASDNDYDEGRPYNSEVWVYGSAYTNDASRSEKGWLSDDNIAPPRAALGYSEWYPLHPVSKELAVPYSRILGRLYEQEAMAFWLASEPKDPPVLDSGREGLLEARTFSRQHDQRITQDIDATWYWGDSRADSLDLHTINGLEIAKFDLERDVRDWRKKIKTIEGMENSTKKTTTAPELTGSRDLRRFMAPGTSSLAVRTHPSPEVGMDRGTPPSSSARSSSSSFKKRAPVVNLSDDEDEEKFRKHTRMVHNTTGSNRKKAKVMVLID